MFNIFYYLIGAVSLWLALYGIFTGEILGMGGLSTGDISWVTFENHPFQFCFQFITFLVFGVAIISSIFAKPNKDKKE